jgi:VanZ family protein
VKNFVIHPLVTEFVDLLASPRQILLHHRVPGFRNFTKYWLPVLLWMMVIFIGSTGAFASENTSRFIGPLLRRLFPGIQEPTIQQVQFVIRKTAHATEYAVLALLCWRALRKPQSTDARPWNWRESGGAFLWTVGYAGLDEFHQSLVPSRQGQLSDVGIDAFGAAAALMLLWLLGQIRRWFTKQDSVATGNSPTLSR